MWTLYDSETNLNYQGAIAYCQALRWGGYSNWQMPTIDELKAIYDPSVEGATSPLKRGGSVIGPDGSKTLATPGQTFPVHIKGEIKLTMAIILARGGAPGTPNDVPWGISFNSGQTSSIASVDPRLSVSRVQMRALCVRPALPGETITNVAHWTGEAPLPEVVHKKHDSVSVEIFQKHLDECNAGIEHGCDLTGFNYKTGWGVDKDIVMAGKYYKMACEMGGKLACMALKTLK